MKIILSFFVALTVHGVPAFPHNGHKQRDGYNLRPFHIDLSENVPHMLDLIRNTQLPATPEYPGVADTAGIDLNVLKSLREEWLTDFDWEEEQTSMNQYLNSSKPRSF